MGGGMEREWGALHSKERGRRGENDVGEKKRERRENEKRDM